ncbi:MAG: AMP-binding protein [Agriterribacter sp.]
MPETLYEIIHQQLTADPSHICIIWPQKNAAAPANIDAVTFLQMIDAYAYALRKCKPHESVLVASAPSPDIIAAIIAIMRVGAIAVLPPANAASKTILQIIRRRKIKQVIVKQPPGIGFRLLAKILGIQFIVAADNNSVSNKPSAIVTQHSPAYGKGGLVSHSSGSTGLPKTINRTYNILTAQHYALKQVFPPWKGQIDFPLFPNVILHNLACGVTSVIPAVDGFKIKNMHASTVLQQIKAQKVQTLTGNVFYYKQLLQELQLHPQELEEVKALGVGGSPVPENLLPALKKYFTKADLYIIYGSSEAEPIAVRKVGNGFFNAADGYFVGNVYAQLNIQIIAAGEIALSNGKMQQVGEIAVRGAHVAVDSPPDWLHTGDFGYLTTDNQLYLTGRKGNHKIQYRVQHYQLEHCLAQIPLIENVAARADEDGFTLFIQGKADEHSIKQILYSQFTQIRINAINFREQLPTDARHHSKIRYDLLN